MEKFLIPRLQQWKAKRAARILAGLELEGPEADADFAKDDVDTKDGKDEFDDKSGDDNGNSDEGNKVT